MYTSNVYLVTGTNNTISDVNTLIDVGRDPKVLDLLPNESTGVGKRAVEQVIITHNHYDHTSMLTAIVERYHPRVCAFSPNLAGVDIILRDEDEFIAGDRMFEVIHIPGHSSDSICLFCKEDGALFAGDTPVVIRFAGDTYSMAFLQALERICRKNVRTIYFGHGSPKTEGCNQALAESLLRVRESTITP
jgi:glyoxylase-like metal-dependent hydrolase (beta-lactamase superfamily II)